VTTGSLAEKLLLERIHPKQALSIMIPQWSFT
jgi:hypothetical protein